MPFEAVVSSGEGKCCISWGPDLQLWHAIMAAGGQSSGMLLLIGCAVHCTAAQGSCVVHEHAAHAAHVAHVAPCCPCSPWCPCSPMVPHVAHAEMPPSRTCRGGGWAVLVAC